MMPLKLLFPSVEMIFVVWGKALIPAEQLDASCDREI